MRNTAERAELPTDRNHKGIEVLRGADRLPISHADTAELVTVALTQPLSHVSPRARLPSPDSWVQTPHAGRPSADSAVHPGTDSQAMLHA